MARFSLIERVQSFKHAFSGLKTVWREEHNFRIHILAALTSVIIGFWLKISLVEWLFLIGAIGGVLSAEIFNSGLENLADAVTKEHNESIKKAKDMGAGAVLIMSIVALIIGLIIFVPKISDVFNI